MQGRYREARGGARLCPGRGAAARAVASPLADRQEPDRRHERARGRRIETARAAVALADETDDLTLRGDAHATLASVLAIAGIEPEIARERTIALACYDEGKCRRHGDDRRLRLVGVTSSSGAGQE